MTDFVDGVEAIEGFFAADGFHVGIDGLGVGLYDFVDVDAGRGVTLIKTTLTGVGGCIFDTLSKRLLLPLLATFVDGIGVVVVVIDRIAPHIFHDPLKLLHGLIVSTLEGILDQRCAKAADNVFWTFVFKKDIEEFAAHLSYFVEVVHCKATPIGTLFPK